MIKLKRSRIRLAVEAYKELCFQVMERDGWKCRICKRRQNLHCHHVIYRSQGGDDIESNLLTVCQNCHDAIHDRWVLILPLVEGGVMDANKDVRIILVQGWTPGKKVKRYGTI